MRNSKTMLLVLALVATVLTAWAGDDGVAGTPRPNSDNEAAAVQAQPAKKEEKPDQTNQPKPREEPAPRSEDRGVQAPERRPDNAQPPQTEHNAVRAPEYRPEVDQTPTPFQRQDRNYAEPVRVESRRTDRARTEPDERSIPQTGVQSNSGRQRGGGRGGGYQGGHNYDPFDRGPSHFFGGRGWHGRHDEWRHRSFHGSWRFLFHFGPVVYFAPIHYPYVIRVPHDRVGIYVRYTGEDAVGSEFANSVREHLRDQGLRVVYSQDDARLELYIVSMEQDPDDPGYNSSVSVSYIWYPGNKFITAQIVDAGLNEVDDLAQSVAGYADELVDDYR